MTYLQPTSAALTVNSPPSLIDYFLLALYLKRQFFKMFVRMFVEVTYISTFFQWSGISAIGEITRTWEDVLLETTNMLITACHYLNDNNSYVF